MNVELVGLSRSFVSRLSSRSFRLRLHPNTSLREAVRHDGGRSGLLEPDTEYSAATVSPCMAVLFRLTLCHEGRVHVAPQTDLAGEGLFPHGEGPIQPLLLLFTSSLVFSKGSREPLPSSPSPRSSPRTPGDRGDGEGAKGRPLLSSPNRGCRLRRGGGQFSPRRTTGHVRFLVFQHVPKDLRQPPHHRHPRDLRAATPLDAAVPGPHPGIEPQDVQH